MGVVAEEKGEWAGIPLPIGDDMPLVIEPSYPNAEKLMAIGRKPVEDDGRRVRNSWYCRKKRCDIVLIDMPDGTLSHGWKPAFHHIKHDLHTLFASDVWGLDQEERALELLASMTSERQFRHYLLTGMFLESSKRSGLFYFFRRLKPTVVASGHGTGDDMRILACLCQHPIAYYEGSWAGALCPTDDVVSHLMQMRADEHLFWKRSNQHPPHRPEAGL